MLLRPGNDRLDAILIRRFRNFALNLDAASFYEFVQEIVVVGNSDCAYRRKFRLRTRRAARLRKFQTRVRLDSVAKPNVGWDQLLERSGSFPVIPLLGTLAGHVSAGVTTTAHERLGQRTRLIFVVNDGATRELFTVGAAVHWRKEG